MGEVCIEGPSLLGPDGKPEGRGLVHCYPVPNPTGFGFTQGHPPMTIAGADEATIRDIVTLSALAGLTETLQTNRSGVKSAITHAVEQIQALLPNGVTFKVS